MSNDIVSYYYSGCKRFSIGFNTELLNAFICSFRLNTQSPQLRSVFAMPTGFTDRSCFFHEKLFNPIQVRARHLGASPGIKPFKVPFKVPLGINPIANWQRLLTENKLANFRSIVPPLEYQCLFFNSHLYL